MNIIAVLDTMWDERRATSRAGHTKEAPKFFQINPKNTSGRRLYSLIETGSSLVVTNACKELVSAAHQHGTPDPKWLCDNLTLLHRGHKFYVILVCGKVAQATYKQCEFKPLSHTRIIRIPHPAARGVWNKEYIEQVKDHIKGVIRL